VVLAAGERREIDLEPEPVPEKTATLRGTVVPVPPGQANVFFKLRGVRIGYAACDEEGRFEAAVPPGELVVEVHYRKGDGVAMREARAVTRPNEVTELVIRLEE
jgi:hypothetical protein